MAELISAVYPVQLRQVGGKNLGIVWNDGHNSFYNVRKLRLACKCAGCIEEWTNRPILDEKSVPQEVHPKKMETMGRYALRFDWSDGHTTGIYTFENLRKLCECPQCRTASV